MAWNRSNDDPSVKAKANAQPNVRTRVLAVVSVLVLAGLAVGIYLFLTGGSRPNDLSTRKLNVSIKEVKPANPSSLADVGQGEKTTGKTVKASRDLPPSVVPPQTVTSDQHAPTAKVTRVGANRRYRKALFNAISDCQIEELVNYEPGVKYLSHFTPEELAKDFMQHITDKVEISPDDEPEIVERKKRYAETRAEIIKQIRAGASLEEMIADARKTLDKMEEMRTNFINALDESQDNGATDDELDDLATAASTLLKEHGVSNPILSPRQQIEAYEKSLQEAVKERQ